MTKINKIVVISKILYNKLFSISQSSKIEECGIFLGFYDNYKFEIKEIVQDDANQFGSGCSTIRQTKNIYEEYQKIISKDNSIDYIGEWHTHPSGKANPSYFDNKAMKFLLNHPEYSFPKELILGIINSKDGLRVFLYQNDIKKMNEVIVKIIKLVNIK